MLVLHDDAEREYGYGLALGLPASRIGSFSQALLERARQEDWQIISMRRDWREVFAGPAP